MPKELLGISPGYYMALGDQDLLSRPGITVSRFYWNSPALIAPKIMGYLTEILNKAGYAFRLKALKDPGLYNRCDAVVLYVEKAEMGRLFPVIKAAYQEVGPRLRSEVPALTKWLAPGLAAADDPNDGESFGMHRCKIIADALIKAAEGEAGPETKIEVVAAAFAAASLDIRQPHLGPSEEDVYDELSTTVATPASAAGRHPVRVGLRPFEVAQLIGDWLVDSAFWDGDICNWIGGSPIELLEMLSLDALANGSLDGDLYGGTSGVAMFLAELAVLSDRPAPFRATALGAIRHSLLTAERADGGDKRGLFDGCAGIAAAGGHVGRLLGDMNVFNRARLLMEGLSDSTAAHAECDLMSGIAGEILGLLIFDKMCPQTATVDAAVRLGDELVDAGQTWGAALTWPTSTVGGRRIGLTGLSHGAAGIGMALAELGVASQMDRFLLAARDAFAYESAFFSAMHSNWADLRWQGTRTSARWATYAPFWCHGAAGIALSRLRTAKATNVSQYLDDAEHGLRSTMRWVEEAITREGAPVVLCHGVLGNAEVLRLADQYRPRERARFCEILSAAEREIGLLFSRDPSKWPCRGAGGLMVPGLMCGLAGVGLYYLRSVAPDTPSMLLLDPKPFEMRS